MAEFAWFRGNPILGNLHHHYTEHHLEHGVYFIMHVQPTYSPCKYLLLVGGFNPSEKYENQLGWWQFPYRKTKMMFQSPPTSIQHCFQGPLCFQGFFHLIPTSMSCHLRSFDPVELTQLFNVTTLGSDPTMAALRSSATADCHWAALWQVVMAPPVVRRMGRKSWKTWKNYSKALKSFDKNGLNGDEQAGNMF